MTFKTWQKENKSKNAMTYADMLKKIKTHPECEMCEHFDMECAECNKNKRPRKIIMLDGPNEYCHMNVSCKEYSRFKKTEYDCQALNSYFAV